MNKAASAPSLIDDVQAMLIKRRGRYKEIAELTGFSYCWVQWLAQGRLKNPSYLRLKQLAELFASGRI